MRNKKATHVGVILSFVIFVTFVIFLIVVLKPTSNLQNSEKATIELLKNNLQNFISSELTSFILSPSSSANCFTLDESNFSLGNLNYSVRNQNNENLNSYRGADILYIEKSDSDQIYKVDYASEELNNTLFVDPADCVELEINSIKKTDKMFESKINELILKQENNYSGLKSDFNIPSEKEFGIIFEFENITTIGKSVPEKRKATYVKKFQVIYLDLNANERTGNFIIYIL